MGINIKLTMVVTTLFVTTINSTCKKGQVCADNNTYTFINNYAKAYPDSDSIRVGDTLWIEISMPTTLKDELTNTMIDFSDAVSVGNTFSIDVFVGGNVNNPGTAYAANNFNYYVINGQSLNSPNPDRTRQYTFAKMGGLFVLKVGVIAKSIGIYSLAISDDAGVHEKGDNCTKASFAFKYANTNQHLYYYQNNRPGYVISDYERQHMYCFKVY